MFRVAISVLALILCRADPAACQIDDRLLDIMDAAAETHPRLQQERDVLRAEREAIPLALAPYRPQLSFQASTARSDRVATLSDGQVIDDETSPSTYTLEARQVIWSGGRRDLALRRSILAVRMAEARFASARQSVQLDALTAYLDLVLASQSLAAQSDAVAALDQLVVATRRRLDRGQATRTDLALIEARRAASAADQARLSADLATGYARMERLAGFRPVELAWPDVEPMTDSIEDTLDFAREHNHGLAEARLSADMARVDLLLAARRNGPTLSLSAQRSESENISPAVVSDDETQINLTLAVPLLSGGENAARRRQAAASRSAARYALRDREEALVLDVHQLWYQLEAARLSAAAQDQRVNASSLALRGVGRGRDAGLWSLMDVLDATEQLAQSRIAQAQARRNLLLATAQLHIMIGSLDWT